MHLKALPYFLTQKLAISMFQDVDKATRKGRLGRVRLCWVSLDGHFIINLMVLLVHILLMLTVWSGLVNVCLTICFCPEILCSDSEWFENWEHITDKWEHCNNIKSQVCWKLAGQLLQRCKCNICQSWKWYKMLLGGQKQSENDYNHNILTASLIH